MMTEEDTSGDLFIDEQSTVDLTVYPSYADGSPVNLTNATITWVASFNGIQQSRKDTDQMTVMVGPQLATTSAALAVSGQNVVKFTKVSDFGADGYARAITDLIPGDIVTIINAYSQQEYCVVASIDPTSKNVTMVDNLVYTHESGNVIKRIIPDFRLRLIPGDTQLPPDKSYGTPIVWEMMARAVFPEGLSPGNIYQEPTTLVLLRGRLFISPILDV